MKILSCVIAFFSIFTLQLQQAHADQKILTPIIFNFAKDLNTTVVSQKEPDKIMIFALLKSDGHLHQIKAHQSTIWNVSYHEMEDQYLPRVNIYTTQVVVRDSTGIDTVISIDQFMGVGIKGNGVCRRIKMNPTNQYTYNIPTTV